MSTILAYTLCCLLLVVLPCHTVRSSQLLFAADFRAPEPPASILAEYQASFVQHKWDNTGISHIASGRIYASTTLQRLRLDLTYEGTISSSFFDYSRANSDGTIPNYVYTMTPTTATQGSCAYYNVTPAYPLFPPNILSASGATFIGLIRDDLFFANQALLQAWSLMFGTTTATAYLGASNTLVRLDFSSPFLSTYATTRLFNIAPGPPNANLFVNPCPPGASTPAPLTSGARRYA